MFSVTKVKYKKESSTYTDSVLTTTTTWKEATAPVTPTEINNFFKHLMGEALTIIEAAIVDDVQRKAVKSVMGNMIHNRSVELQQWIIHRHEDELTGKGSNNTFPYNW